MKFERSKDWWMARARREGDAVIGAGLLAFDPALDERASSAQTVAVEETRIAFGKFVNLMRRRRGFSMEELAQAADLDASELLVIEDDVHYVPEPRTVFKLAETLRGVAAATHAACRIGGGKRCWLSTGSRTIRRAL